MESTAESTQAIQAQILNQGSELKEKVSLLQQALLERHPQMPQLLRVIHNTLQQYPEQVTILSEEDIAVIVNGLEKQTGVELAASVSTPKATSAKAARTKQIKELGEDAF